MVISFSISYGYGHCTTFRYMKKQESINYSLTHDEYIFGKVIRQKFKVSKKFQ